MAAQILDANEVDLARHVAAMRKAFHGSPWAGEISATLTEEFYKWKYDTPAGRAQVAYVMSGSEPISGVSAFPMTLELPDHGLAKGWQIGDIMTAPEARGRGLYRKCLSALVERLDDELLICFPNNQSRRAIEQAGFAPVAAVETFARPILPALLRRGPASPGPPRFFAVAGTATTSQFAGVHKDRDYLEWRYARHPAFSYQTVGGAEGLAVVRGFKLLGANVVVVMEFHPTDGSAAQLLKKVHHWGKENGMVASFLMANWFAAKPFRSGYMFVPSPLLPKRQVLYVRCPRGREDQLNWQTQIGDWDGL